MDILKVIGNNIRIKRKENGLSTQEVADYIDLKRSSYLNIECGQRKPTGKQLVLLGELFNCFSTDFISIEGVSEEDSCIVKELIEQLKEVIASREERITDLIMEAVSLSEKGYSIKGFLSVNDKNDIVSLLKTTLKIRVDQLYNKEKIGE